MNSTVQRQTVDLSSYPDLVVVYLGMRVIAWTGIKTLLGLGPQIQDAVGKKPDGLLLHEDFIMSLFPLHLGMRQYWRDFNAKSRRLAQLWAAVALACGFSAERLQSAGFSAGSCGTCL